MQPKTTLWPLDPHTKGKHLVLRRYLDAWLPIMGRYNGRILFIDGFAGPGEYEGGEEGSPIIALKAFCGHPAKIRAEVGFLFIEKRHDRATHLETLVEELRACLPRGCWAKVLEGAFDDTMMQALDDLDAQEKNLAPALVMIDPFGVSGTPMHVVQRILRNPKSEVYISFMYDSINRFKDTPEFPPHLDELFGCQDWRDGVGITDPIQRKNFFYSLYDRQLRIAGAKHVLRFELYERGRLVYAIFFGTQNLTGCERMKQAIWRIAPWGDFAFRGTYSSQLTLGLENPDIEPLKVARKQEFHGKGWVTIKDICDFVSSDKTDYHTGHIKTATLAPMEDNDEIEVNESTRQRKKTYPQGTRIRFL